MNVLKKMKVGDLVKVTHGSGSGIVGVIAVVVKHPGMLPLMRLHTGEHFGIERLEVINASR